MGTRGLFVADSGKTDKTCSEISVSEQVYLLSQKSNAHDGVGSVAETVPSAFLHGIDGLVRDREE